MEFIFEPQLPNVRSCLRWAGSGKRNWELKNDFKEELKSGFDGTESDMKKGDENDDVVGVEVVVNNSNNNDLVDDFTSKRLCRSLTHPLAKTGVEFWQVCRCLSHSIRPSVLG